MRQDEEYAKDSIGVYLKNKLGFSCNIIEGEDPPDYYILKGNDKIVLEITTAESIFTEEGKQSKKRTVTESVATLCDDLDNELKNLIPPQKSLLLILHTPINNFSQFKKQLRLILMEIIENDQFFNQKLNINGEIIEARWVIDKAREHKSLIGIIGSKNPICNIQQQTSLIVEKMIREKVVKLERINGKIWRGEKWLGIINNYPLADHSNFSKVLRDTKAHHDFSKIFLIEKDSIVVEILNN